MKKVIIFLFFCFILFVSCEKSTTVSSSEIEIVNSVSSENSNIGNENRAIYHLSYFISKDTWVEIDNLSNIHWYHSVYDMDTMVYVQYDIEIDGVPINPNTILSDIIASSRQGVEVVCFETEAGTFQNYPCIYIHRSININQDSSDEKAIKRINQYSLIFVVDDTLYTVILSSPNDLEFYMDDFNEIIDSIVITPI